MHQLRSLRAVRGGLTFVGLALVACSGRSTAARVAVEGETADSTTAAFIRVTSDGGNTAETGEWTVDSAGSAVFYVGRRKDLPAGSAPVAQVTTLVSQQLVRDLFAATQAVEFRRLLEHYPAASATPDVARHTITVVANGRRRKIDGVYPDPAFALERQLMSLAPRPAGL